jgi:pimeloyl-ACP methyl ester carboxylesterase
MSKFILVHGGAHGAWCWDTVKADLERRGHTALALDLPGHGADETPRSIVTRSSYVNAIVSILDAHPNDTFTLVGHSLAGISIPEVALARPDQIEALIFVAALVLMPGEKVIDFIPVDRRSSYFRKAEEAGDNSFLVDYNVARRVFFNDLSDEDAARYFKLLTPQPFGIYQEIAKVDVRVLPQPRQYVVCRDDHALGYESCLEFSRRLGGSLREISCGHDVMLSQPHALVTMLLGS